MKNVVVLFSAPGFTAEHFDQVWDDLRAAGQSHPKGLISHVGFAKPDGSWNVVAFVFSISMPIAAWFASRYFVPFYRSTGEISAYMHLEKRFG